MLAILSVDFSRFDSLQVCKCAKCSLVRPARARASFLVVFFAIADDSASGFPLDDVWLWPHDAPTLPSFQSRDVLERRKEIL